MDLSSFNLGLLSVRAKESELRALYLLKQEQYTLVSLLNHNHLKGELPPVIPKPQQLQRQDELSGCKALFLRSRSQDKHHTKNFKLAVRCKMNRFFVSFALLCDDGNLVFLKDKEEIVWESMLILASKRKVESFRDAYSC